jgi:hypothetical protein
MFLQFFRRLLTYFSILVALSALPPLLMHLSLSEQRRVEVEHAIRLAFSSGALLHERVSTNPNDTRRGAYVITDCLVLQTILLRQANREPLISSPKVYLNDAPCETLDRSLVENVDRQTLPKMYSYSRYFFAAALPTIWLLPVLGIDNLKFMLSLTSHTILFIVFVWALTKMYRTNLVVHSQNSLLPSLMLASVSSTLLIFYDLRLFAPTLAHGFSEIVIALWLCWLALCVRKMKASGTFATFQFGIFTGWFELLTGPAPIGLAIVALAALTLQPDGSRWRRVALLCSVYVGGMLGSLFIYQILLYLFTGESQIAKDFITHLALRLQLHNVLGLELPETWRNTSNLRHYSVSDVYVSVADALPVLTYSSRAVSQLLFIAASGVIVITLLCAPRTRSRKIISQFAPSLETLTAMIGLIPVAWFLAFSNHTVIHVFMMVRVASIMVFCAILICAIAVARRLKLLSI